MPSHPVPAEAEEERRLIEPSRSVEEGRGPDGVAQPRKDRWAEAPLLGASAAGVCLLGLGAAFGAPWWPPVVFGAVAAVALRLHAGRSAGDFAVETLRAERAAERAAACAALRALRAGDLVEAALERPHLGAPVHAALVGAAGELAGLAERLRSTNGETAQATDSVVRMTADLASSSAELSASVTEITAAMEELARTASGISERAVRLAELSARVEARGAVGEDALVEALGGVVEVEGRIAAIAARTDILGARSKEIYRVLDLIAEIAEETHILSLNAAIEASAAGDEGRRSTVVAEQVRRLASRSRDSVASVRALLDEFSVAIRGTVVATEEGAKEIRQVLGSAERAAVAVAELRAVAALTAARALRISGSTREQDAASDEVVATLRDVGYVIDRTSSALTGLDGAQSRLERLVLGVELLAQGLRRESPFSLLHQASAWALRFTARSEADSQADSEAEVELALDSLRVEAPYLDDAYLVDATGYALGLGSRRRPDGDGVTVVRERDLSGRPWFRAAVARRRSVLTAPYVSMNGRTCFTVAVPIFGPEGDLTAVLGVDVDVHNWTRIGAGGPSRAGT